MNLLTKSIFIFFAVLTLTQCTIEKRLYNRGFHVEWNQKINCEKEYIQTKTNHKQNILATSIQSSDSSSELSLIESDLACHLKTESNYEQSLHETENINSVQDIETTINPVNSEVKSETQLTSKPLTEIQKSKRKVYASVMLLLVIIGSSLLILSAIPLLSITNIIVTLIFVLLILWLVIYNICSYFKLKKAPLSEQNRITTKQEKKEKSNTVAVKEKKLANKKNAAIAFTLITLFMICGGISLLISMDIAYQIMGFLMLFVTLIFSLIVVILWDDYSDLKKTTTKEENPIIQEEVKDSNPKKNRAWLIFVFIGIGGLIALIDHISHK